MGIRHLGVLEGAQLPGRRRVLAGNPPRRYAASRFLYLCGLVLLGSYYVKAGRYPAYDWLFFAAVLGAWGNALTRHVLPRMNPALALAGVLIVVSGVATVPQDVHGIPHSTYSLVLYLYLIGLWIPVASIVLQRWSHIESAFVALVLGMTITSLYAIGQKSLGWPILGARTEFWGRVTGLTRHPNELGTLCAMIVPYALGLLMNARGLWPRLWWVLALLIGVVALMLSGSMTGLLSGVTGVATFFWLYRSRITVKKTAPMVVGVALMVMGGLWLGTGGSQSALQRVEDFLHSSSGRVTLYQRIEGDQYAWERIVREPIRGRGYHAKAANVDTEIHNGLLRAWYDGGFFALLAVIVLLVGAAASLRNARRLVRRQPVIGSHALVSASGAAFASFLVMMMASPTLYQRSSWFAVAIVFAVAAVARREVGHWPGAHGRPAGRV